MKRLSMFLLVVISVLAACQHESSSSVGEVKLNQLTNGADSKSWKIETATLQNANSSGLTISNLANVRDDEFVFRTANAGHGLAAMLNWHIGNDIRTDASTTEKALLDYYLSSSTHDLTIQDDGKITSSDPNLKVELISENKVSLQYTKGQAQLSLILIPTKDDKTFRLADALQFEKVTEITGNGLDQAAGFTGSMASNSLYIAYKDLNVLNTEKVVKYDIGTGQFKSQSRPHTDLVSKELYIINDELKVIGASYVSTYSLDLDKSPVSVPDNLRLSRFGSTVVDKNIFLFGGDLNATGDKIYQHNQATGQLSSIGTLPKARYWAHGEMVDDKLYVFGGREVWDPSTAADDNLFVWDLPTGNTTTLKLPRVMSRTFTARYQHLIVVGAHVGEPGENTETLFGIFNTRDNTFTTLPTSLSGSDRQTIFGLTVVGDALYVLYGAPSTGTPSATFSIYKASLQK